MGERDTAEGMALDAALMPLITSVSIACGGHAGSGDLMRRTASVAQQHGVAMGAHPGLPDRETFGRTERPVTANEIRALVSEQVMVCGRVLKTEGFTLRHVKPHGALYTMAARDEGSQKPLSRPCATLTASFCCMPWLDRCWRVQERRPG